MWWFVEPVWCTVKFSFFSLPRLFKHDSITAGRYTPKKGAQAINTTNIVAISIAGSPRTFKVNGTDSIFFNTVKTHQSIFFFTKGVSNKKRITSMHICIKSLSVLSYGCQWDLFLTIVERDHVFNLRTAEKDLFLLRWLQDLPAEVCK